MGIPYKKLLLYGLTALVISYLIPTFFLKNKYYINLLNLIGIYIIITTGLNIITGYCGQINIGQGGFCAIGAYTTALFTLHITTSLPVLLVASIVVTGLVGLLVGISCLRLAGTYIAMTTLGFGAIVEVILFGWEKLTRGSDGLRDIPYPKIVGSLALGGEEDLLYVISLITIVLLLFAYNVVNSRLGRAFMAIRDDQLAANLSGINVPRYKLYAFIMCACYGGIGGCLYLFSAKCIFPEVFGLDFSILSLMMMVLGGMGSIMGGVLGAALLTVSFELLRPLKEYQMVVYGILIVIIAIFIPKGLLGVGMDAFSFVTRRLQK
jgi:branched-chain amino acid transport system permease protein